MNFTPLFLTARVVGAVYKTVLTTWLGIHLAKRIYGRESPRNGRAKFGERRSRKFGEGPYDD